MMTTTVPEGLDTNSSVPAELSQDFERAFVRYRAMAEHVPDAQVQPMRADLGLALHNAVQGVSWVESFSMAVTSLPGMDPAVLVQLPMLVGATMIADKRIRCGPNPELRALMKEGRELRCLLLSSAMALAVAGVFPEHQVARIRKGRGAIDVASDLIDLAMLYRNHTAAHGQSPVSRAQVNRSAELGTELLQQLKREYARKGTGQEQRNAILLRDKFWTLVMQRHEDLRRCASFIFGPEEVDHYVPALLSHRGHRRLEEDGSQEETTSPESLGGRSSEVAI